MQQKYELQLLQRTGMICVNKKLIYTYAPKKETAFVITKMEHGNIKEGKNCILPQIVCLWQHKN
jgi:hypothetical protein